MLNFRLWFENDVSSGSIKVHLPKVSQQRKGACGAQAFRSICLYYNVGPEEEKEHMELLGTTKDGTWPESIVKHAKELGFQVRSKIGMKIKDLIEFLDHKIPVICAMQAWGDPKKYLDDSNGHYVVAIGYDEKNMYFEDPIVANGHRGFLSYKEFMKRWHDVDAHGHDCNQLGIAMWKDNPKKSKRISQVQRIK